MARVNCLQTEYLQGDLLGGRFKGINSFAEGVGHDFYSLNGLN